MHHATIMFSHYLSFQRVATYVMSKAAEVFIGDFVFRKKRRVKSASTDRLSMCVITLLHLLMTWWLHTIAVKAC